MDNLSCYWVSLFFLCVFVFVLLMVSPLCACYWHAFSLEMMSHDGLPCGYGLQHSSSFFNGKYKHTFGEICLYTSLSIISGNMRWWWTSSSSPSMPLSLVYVLCVSKWVLLFVISSHCQKRRTVLSHNRQKSTTDTTCLPLFVASWIESRRRRFLSIAADATQSLPSLITIYIYPLCFQFGLLGRHAIGNHSLPSPLTNMRDITYKYHIIYSLLNSCFLPGNLCTAFLCQCSRCLNCSNHESERQD